MDSVRWEQLQTLFHDAAGQPAAERLSFLRTAAGGDEQLFADVLGMLDADASASSLLDSDVAQIAGQMLAGPASVLPPVQDFGPYRVRGVLGEGGMGVVYLAEREDLGTLVAIKILRDAWMSPARRDRFALEQRALARLNHPSIARLYDADSLPDGTPWFVMEYVDGVPLTDFCTVRQCSIPERLQLFRAVCEAVEHAHSHAILHRDLKPSNILVKPDGSVRLLDFGIAKQLEEDPDSGMQTRTGLRLMTLAYAAPEQIRDASASIQSDVYSLGVILYELLTGRVPFDPAGRSAGELERLILERDPEPPSAVAPGSLRASNAFSADLDVLCAAAMHKDVARRYRSVEALIRDLDHYFRAEPLECRPDTLAYRAAKFVHRNTGAVAASAVVVIAVTVLVAFFVARLTTARDTALLQAQRTKRIQSFTLNLFNGGDKDVGPGAGLRVIALIDRGVQEAESLKTEPGVQAELYETLGTVYRNLGKLDRADTLLQLALDQRRGLLQKKAPNISRVDLAESQIALGLLRSDQARLDEAERLVREGLGNIGGTLPASSPVALKATTALGKVLEVRGEYAKAIAVLDQVVNSPEVSGAESPEFADALGELADNHFYSGHYDICEVLFARVLRMHRRIHGEEHPKVAEDLIDLGATQMERGQYQESEKLDRQALAITEKFYGPDHPQTASALTQLGRSLYYEKRYDDAGILLHRALAIQERVHGPVHPAVASALNELGNIASASGRYPEAEADFRRMVEIYREVYHDHHYLIGTAESNLATVYVGEKQYTRAEALYRDAIQRFSDTLPPTHTSIGIARVKLGHVLLLEQRYREAEPQTLGGYRILSGQMSPSTTWMRNARKDLREIYPALGHPERSRDYADAVAEYPAGRQGR